MLYLERWKLFKPRFKDIWKVDISIDESIGHEQSGTRPCLIISFFKEAGLSLVIPLTSNLETKHFPYTVKIEKNPINELKKDSIALVYQMKSISMERFISKIGRMSTQKYKEIEIQLKDILRLPVS